MAKTLRGRVAWFVLRNPGLTLTDQVRAHVREHGAKPPPPYLQDAHYAGAQKLGRGVGYVYPHDQPGGVADQPLAPEEVRAERFYEPTDRGYEGELRKRTAEIRKRLQGRGK